MSTFADVGDVEKAWRPLSDVERTRAEYYIGRAERLILRRFPDARERVADPVDALSKADVVDVVVALVLAVVPKPVADARSWQQTAGPFTESVTLPAANAATPMRLEDWMIEVFTLASESGPAPRGSFPSPGPYDQLFGWRE